MKPWFLSQDKIGRFEDFFQVLEFSSLCFSLVFSMFVAYLVCILVISFCFLVTTCTHMFRRRYFNMKEWHQNCQFRQETQTEFPGQYSHL